ncbi:UNVERIFIED_CONTAM: hypothetical protein FKN15_065833 [Acipenser sinensis]
MRQLPLECPVKTSDFAQPGGRGRQPIDIRLSVLAVTRRGLPIENITGAEALVESCGDGEPQKKKRETEQSISSSRGETLGSPVYHSFLYEKQDYTDQNALDYFLFKFLVIGSAGTGKSCLLHQFIENKFKQDSNHTIGVEFGSKVVNVGGKTVKLQIWDTAGQERFRSVTRSYYRGAAGALLVYDITSRETYNALTNWLTDARTLASPNIVIILCGNKKDLDADREVTFLEASRFAQENELMFLETSALTGENVEEAFLKCARNILNKIESGELDPERMGSGIQYGDASLRQLRQPRGVTAQNQQQCNC